MYHLNGVVPNVGARGRYFLLKPWVIDESKLYRCERISSLLDFKIHEKKDVLQEIYKKNNLTEVEYHYALKHNIKIVTLKHSDDDVIHVPDNYIQSMPDQGYVPYSNYIISANLGLLPEGIALDDLIGKINDLIKQSINVTVKALVHRYESKTFISSAEHIERENVRKSNILPTPSSWQIIKDLEQKNAILAKAINELQERLAN